MTGGIFAAAGCIAGMILAQAPDPVTAGGKLAQMGVTGILGAGLVGALLVIGKLHGEMRRASKEHHDKRDEREDKREKEFMEVIVANTEATTKTADTLDDLQKALDRNSAATEGLQVSMAKLGG